MFHHSWTNSIVCKNWMAKLFHLCSRFTFSVFFVGHYCHFRIYIGVLDFRIFFSTDKISVSKPRVSLERKRNGCFLLHAQMTLTGGKSSRTALLWSQISVQLLLILELLLLCAVPLGSCKLFAPSLLVSTWSFAKVRRMGRLYSSQSLPSVKR